MRRERRVLVVAEVDLRDLDAGELGLVLEQVVDLLLADRGLHRDRGERIGVALVDLPGELSRRDVDDRREATDKVIAALARHVADPEPNGGAGDVRDHRAPVPVEDGAARRLDADEAKLVVLSRVQVLVSREHLERPEAQEEDRKDHERDGTENADPQSEWRTQAIGLANARIRRQEPSRGRAALVVCTVVRQEPRPPRPVTR